MHQQGSLAAQGLAEVAASVAQAFREDGGRQ